MNILIQALKKLKILKIGIEHEKFLFNSKDNSRVNYSKIKQMFEALQEFGESDFRRKEYYWS